MTSESSEKAIIASALVVTAVYLFRYFSEGVKTPKQEKKEGKIPRMKEIFGLETNIARPVSFAVGMGFVFFVISLVDLAAPTVGGYGAILVATADVLTNASAVLTDIGKVQTQHAA